MISFEPIDAATVPGWPYVYVVGSFDRRITFFSQQVRGFNLVHALAQNRVLGDRTRFAVVGAGAAGLASGSALSLLVPGAVVDVFEREQHPLHLQRDCDDRNLHPHIYEWPRAVARSLRAGLPFLDWTQGSASNVAADIMRQFGMLQWSAPREVVHPLSWSEDHFGWNDRWQGSGISRKRSSPSCVRLTC